MLHLSRSTHHLLRRRHLATPVYQSRLFSGQHTCGSSACGHDHSVDDSDQSTQMRVPYHPSVEKNTMERIQKYFPNAQFALEMNQRVNFALLKEGSTKENTLYACSVCPDEINHYHNSLNNRLTRVAGRAFYMGGLAGIPFAGKCGYNAFTGHMPKDGNLVIQFCPHIGISKDGDFGKYSRHGQDCPDLACGAAIGAYSWLKENEWEPQNDKTAPVVVPADTDSFDYQFTYIKEALKPYFAEIEAAEEPQVALAYALYEITRSYIEQIVVPIENVKITMLGGIQINVQQPCGDLFMPLMFEVRVKDQPTKDLLHVFKEVITYQ